MAGPEQHHSVALATVAFKAAALLTYIVSGFTQAGFVVVFVVCLVLLSVDFWVVKNVSGRLLVGLRWWNEIAEDGSSAWRFEKASEERQKAMDAFERKLFWYTLYGTPAVWLLLGIVGAVRFKIDYLLIVVIALAMNFSNVVGYVKASREQSQQVGTVVSGLKTAVGAMGGATSLI